MADVAAEIMQKNNLKPEDIAFLVPHQANLRIMTLPAGEWGFLLKGHDQHPELRQYYCSHNSTLYLGIRKTS